MPDHYLYLEGEVGFDFKPGDLRRELDRARGGSVVIEINSPGGIATDGVAMHNMLRDYPGATTVRVVGVALSAAFVLAIGADRVEGHASATFMIHSAGFDWLPERGTADKLREMADEAAQLDEVVVGLIEQARGIPAATARGWLRRNTWFTAEEAVEAGVIDAIYQPGARPAVEPAAADYTRLSDAPAHLVRLAVSRGWTSRQKEKTMENEQTGAEQAAPERSHTVAQHPRSSAVTARERAQPAAGQDETRRVRELARLCRTSAGRMVGAINHLDAWIDRGVSPEEAREAVLNMKADQAQDGGEILNAYGRNGVGHSWDAGPGLAQRQARALAHRINRGVEIGEGQDFSGASLPQLAMSWSRAHGMNAGSEREAVRLVMSAGAHSSSDFMSTVVGQSVELVTGFMYEQQQPEIARVSREVPREDYLQIKQVRTGAASTLAPVVEGGEFTHASMSEEGDFLPTPEINGKLFSVTEQALANDRINALDNIARAMTMGAVERIRQGLCGVLVGPAGAGIEMRDGNPVFHADHGNLVTSGTALDVSSLGAVATIMRRQTGPGGESLNIRPAFLVVPPELETTALQLVADIASTSVAEVNPYAGRLEVLVEQGLSDTGRWYLAADGNLFDGLAHAFVGSSGPRVETRNGWETPTVDFRVRLDVGFGFLDWRSWVMNPGA